MSATFAVRSGVALLVGAHAFSPSTLLATEAYYVDIIANACASRSAFDNAISRSGAVISGQQGVLEYRMRALAQINNSADQEIGGEHTECQWWGVEKPPRGFPDKIMGCFSGERLYRIAFGYASASYSDVRNMLDAESGMVNRASGFDRSCYVVHCNGADEFALLQWSPVMHQNVTAVLVFPARC